MYEEDNSLTFEFTTAQKFGKLSVSVPTEVDEVPKIQETLQKLRDALKIKGKIEVL